MSAHALWAEIRAGGWASLSRWRTEKKTEGLHLDFKQAGFDAKGDVRGDDLKNLARGMSAFGNTEGGLLVFGPETERGPGKAEVLKALKPVDAPLHEYEERLRLRVREITTPSMPAVEVIGVEDPDHPGKGVVVVYVPASDGAPYRAEGSAAEVSKRYFMRTTTDTEVIPHQILASMFGRRPFPRFRVGLVKAGDGSVAVRLENIGAGMALMPLLRLRVEREANEEIHGLHSQTAMYWEDRLADIAHGTEVLWDVAVLLPERFRLYPNETRTASWIRLKTFTRTVRVRVDCDHALPFEAVREITVSETIAWLQAPNG